MSAWNRPRNLAGSAPPARYEIAATGGTFDLLHRGHLELLSAGFSCSSLLIIGLSSDDFAARRGKVPFNNYLRRLENLSSLIRASFSGPAFRILRLDSDFGPAVLEGGVQALVVSEETAGQGERLNRMRAERGLEPVEVVTVPLAEAYDGRPISSTRLKNLEIDFDGRMLGAPKKC